MKSATSILFVALLVLCSCGRKETDGSEELPPEVKRQFVEFAKRQAAGLDGATAIVHNAYNYAGVSLLKPDPGAKLVAVETTLAIGET